MREEAFKGYVIDGRLLSEADPSAIVMHCLPAYRGKEITAEVIDGPARGSSSRRPHVSRFRKPS
jgi:ornithine carbamoyltransferase (EC 2.1.3.3)